MTQTEQLLKGPVMTRGVSLPKALNDALIEKARLEDRPISRVIRSALVQYFTDQSNGSRTWLDVLEGALVALAHKSPRDYTPEVAQAHKIVLTAQARPAKLKMLLLPVYKTEREAQDVLP